MLNVAKGNLLNPPYALSCEAWRELIVELLEDLFVRRSILAGIGPAGGNAQLLIQIWELLRFLYFWTSGPI